MTVGFSHEALFYAGTDGFLAGTLPFVRAGIGAGERVVVAVPPEHSVALREALAGDSDEGDVTLLEMQEIGRNPAWIIPAWHTVVAEALAQRRPLRAIGEPVWPERSGDELVECHKHEALLNVAFGDGPAWRLVCPYDTSALPTETVDEAKRTHPFILDGGGVRPSPDYVDPSTAIEQLEEELPAPPVDAHSMPVGPEDLSAARRLTGAYAHASGLSANQRADITLAVSELLSNSLRHGGGNGTLTLWREPSVLCCEVRDRGHIDDLLAGRRAPDPMRPGSCGLWIVSQVCDLVQIRSRPGANVVRVRVAAG